MLPEFLPRIVSRGGGFVFSGGSFDGLTVEVVEQDGVPHLVLGGTVTLPPWSVAPDPSLFVEEIPVRPMPVDATAEPAYRPVLGGGTETRD